ncbi:hypothetical protein SALBM311S_06013 [Streptomyces alboniger]
MVMRYFGNKEGLLAAAVTVDLKLPDLGSLPRQDVGRVLVTHFLDMWEENEVLTAMLRVGVTNQDGSARMQGIFRDQLLPVTREVCPDPEQVPTRAALAATQLLGLALTPGTYCDSRRRCRARPGGGRGVAGARGAAVPHGAVLEGLRAAGAVQRGWPRGPDMPRAPASRTLQRGTSGAQRLWKRAGSRSRAPELRRFVRPSTRPWAWS